MGNLKNKIISNSLFDVFFLILLCFFLLNYVFPNLLFLEILEFLNLYFKKNLEK
jgi:hypothetical protein